MEMRISNMHSVKFVECITFFVEQHRFFLVHEHECNQSKETYSPRIGVLSMDKINNYIFGRPKICTLFESVSYDTDR